MTGLSLDNKKKLNNDFLDEIADFGPFSPTLPCFWPRFQCLKLLKNTVDPIVARLSEMVGKIVIDSDFLDENADFGHFSPFLACFWPVKAPVSVSKALNGYI